MTSEPGRTEPGWPPALCTAGWWLLRAVIWVSWRREHRRLLRAGWTDLGDGHWQPPP